ncbi:YcxB family protein [Aquibacillus kalidii]|uniref:YcxB family protein n=1 Tax=Aquibacillus kalidii TaxID=2762597 RepID=UPI001646A4A6|nr:YcxB family protein [Aquibacillus kalidii]
MEFTYTLTEEDYINFNLTHVKQSITVKRSIGIQRFSIPIIYIALAFVMSALLDIPVLWMLVPFSVLSVIWVITYPKIFLRSIRKNASKMIKEGKNENLLGTHHMIVNDNGLTDINENGETKVNWSGIDKVVHEQDYIFLYNSSVSAYIIPKRELSSRLDEFLTIVKEKTGR